jgi:hypothetical protein
MRKTWLSSMVREPPLHFLLIGAAMFLYFRWSGGGAGPASTRIVLGSAQLASIAAGYARTWQRPPSEAELKALIDDWVREEISVREATAAGLDRDDTVLRRRLRQKFEFLVEEVNEAARPTDAELQAWLASHASEFRADPHISFRQVFLSPARRGTSVGKDARQLLALLRSAGAAVRTDNFGDSSMLPQEFELISLRDIGRTFGEGFAARVGAVDAGTWTGPIESAYGLHLVFVRDRVEGETPDLASIRPAVERELMVERRQRHLKATYDRLLEKYTVDVEGARHTKQMPTVARTEQR